MERPDINTINEKYVDVAKIMGDKGVKLPKWGIKLLGRILHLDEINAAIYKNREYFGLEFARKFIEGKDPQDLGCTIVTIGLDNIPAEGYPIVLGNHPLGGPDGLSFMDAVGRKRQDIQFPVNDFLLYLPGLRELFVPIDKINKSKALAQLEEAFAGQNTLCYFPAGMCSRRINGKIQDPEWKPTIIKKAVKYHRDVVPTFTDARNRNSFYNIARLRKWLGIKFNFDMVLLPAEMFAQHGKTIKVTFGKIIPWQTFDNRHTPAEWAELLRKHVYHLKEDPNAEFIG